MIDAERARRVHESVQGRRPDDAPTGDHGGKIHADIKRGPYGDGRYTDFGADDFEPVRTGRDVAKRGPEIIAAIWDRRDEPLVPIEIGDGVLVETYLGGIVLLIGGTGAGKTSLALESAIRHAIHRGPALVASLELPQRIIGARVVGIGCDESWSGVLTGRVQREHMLQRWPDRLRIMERRDVTIPNLHASIAALRAEITGGPLLVVVDYVQLIDNEEREIRRRVAQAMQDLDDLANTHSAVVLALSQGSRASARQLASGEKLGRDTADAGAEAQELERWSTHTIAIGGHGPADGDWCPVDISIGKGRIGAGDMVYQARYCGRSGAWRVAGDARPADKVRAERQAAVDDQKRQACADQLVGAATRSPAPLARETLCKQVKGVAAQKRQVLAELIERGELVEVMERANRSRAWLVWTRANAAAAGKAIVDPSQGGGDD